MSTKTTQLSWHDERRPRAWELREQGWNQQYIAAALGVTVGAVSQWLKQGRDGAVSDVAPRGTRHPEHYWGAHR